jgi:hypothetical protein
MRYDLVLTGPGNQKIEISVSAGEDYTQPVSLGEWRVEAEAYNPENVLIGTGSTTVTVKAGKNMERVPMRAVPQEVIAVTGITGVPAAES